jgi:hypothetical protein
MESQKRSKGVIFFKEIVLRGHAFHLLWRLPFNLPRFGSDGPAIALGRKQPFERLNKKCEEVKEVTFS